MSATFKLGLLVNPFAGIGGSVALKGSDGEEIRDEALKRGAQKLAAIRAEQALSAISNQVAKRIELVTASGEMGENSAKACGFHPTVLVDIEQPSSASDTQRVVKLFEQQGVDTILFAGGDGTARDVFAALDLDIPVLGIPAGCKIHSGVYAVTPRAAGHVIEQLVSGQLLSLKEASVMDIDEQAFRAGTVRAKNFGSMRVPDALQFIQATKEGGKEVEALVLDDIAADVIENMEPDIYYAIGSGSTCAVVMEQLGLANTLLGVDLIRNNELIAADVSAADLLDLVEQGNELQVILTLIGGQGHILGRGNQQISAKLIRHVGWHNIHIIATKAKLKALNGRPLIVDTGDPELDDELAGAKAITTGYHDQVLYRVGLEL
ncbi:ATP-NAD kinase family protein [Pleionea mediterranea]|uniref:Putative polyphosphate/ATP-dependent NAD kinase n=1 Tax=Pleionea mediterranea TaxID=523701 RepID=A0A316G0C0_9GAMM|nr:ATP-NAD kinase family protein [Pleionea mediterranea]PWK53240.1 putative polyphosphate/ATP-dependent NAD kinase [Pleionea mediterranea]